MPSVLVDANALFVLNVMMAANDLGWMLPGEVFSSCVHDMI